MQEEPATTRSKRGEALEALAREDLDVYGVAELEARIAALREEITRSEIVLARKSRERSAADALFAFGTSAASG